MQNLSSLSALFPIVAAIVNRRHLNHLQKIAAVFFIISALFDFSLLLVRHFNITLITTGGRANNAPLIHLFILVSVFFYALIYFYAFNKLTLKKLSIIFAGIAGVLILTNAFFIEGLSKFPSIGNTILSVTLILLSLLYFWQLLDQVEIVRLEKQPMFWISAGVLSYCSINIFLFMLIRSLGSLSQNFWTIHSIINIIANSLFAIALFCKPRKTI
ncbi:hypothetical protein [Pedobacter steynii]|uniref:hypothetical protein n=1 Tax=Pedobacter steynii TaxID=430522 RepID=UPI0012F9A1C7|nr:hypothetical protein [Pedobacter steynii]